jgi:hypothetical protein
MRFSALRGTLTLASLALLGACSLVNAPDDVDPSTPTTSSNTGGAGGAGTGAAGGAGGSGGMAPDCTGAEQCAALATDCSNANCVDGSCVLEPKAAGTPCGPSDPESACDLGDRCDDAGNCVDADVVDGTFCADCPAGPGRCGLCAAGACPDCTTRATTKTFRSPIATRGWTLTGDWRVYEETPPWQPGNIFDEVPECANGLDDDGDQKIDGADSSCTGPNDPYERTSTQCNDGVDNDLDGVADLVDADCAGSGDDYEVDIRPIRFSKPVLGTDGNRAAPYSKPGAEREVSSATSPPTVLPPVLRFRSWHSDEGFRADFKAVLYSTNGQDFLTLAECPEQSGNPPPPPPYAFCTRFGDGKQRGSNAWDSIELPVPATDVGKVAQVRFLYGSNFAGDEWERGWYVDELNFATDCACDDAADCGLVAGDCAESSCDVAIGECVPIPTNLGGMCTADVSPECSAPQCSSNGLCDTNASAFEKNACMSCDAGPGLCQGCISGKCESCPEVQHFFGPDFDFDSWTFEGDWFYQAYLAPNSLAPNPPSGLAERFPFPANVNINDIQPEDLNQPLTVPSIGTNGCRTPFPFDETPSIYTFEEREISTGSVRSPVSLLPSELRFQSWHQDRGGKSQVDARDKKKIRVSIDDGITWTTLVDCVGNSTMPFCQPSPDNVNRDPATWDAVAIPIPSQLVGQMGIVEFSYDSVDIGDGWERGWFIDDINVGRCN